MATSRAIGLAMVILLFLLTSEFFCDFHILAASSDSHLSNKQFQGPDVEAGNLGVILYPSSVSFRATAGSIQLEDIPQMISLALGFSSLQDIEWKGLLAGNIFSHPKVNILFVIEGFDKGVTLPFFSKTQSYPIVKKVAEPNVNVLRISPSQNIISHITTILKKKPLVISFSAENKFARGSSATGPNAHTVTWDTEKNSFLDNNPDGFTFSRKELLKSFETVDFGEDVKYEKDEGSFVVSVPGMEGISFDMNDKEDFLFFAELGMIFNLFNKVKDLVELTDDGYLDFFTFGISSLKGLSYRYGNNSHQVVAALRVLNYFIPQISSLFNELYGGQALVEVVTFQMNEINDLYQHIQDHLQSPSLENFQQNLPEVKLRDNLEDNAVTKICESVQNKLLAMHSSLKVNCGVSTNKHIRKKREVAGDQDKGCVRNLASVYDKYDNNYPAIFNIILWLMIILVIALYAISLVLWYMDPGRDSLIYRVTSQRMKTE